MVENSTTPVELTLAVVWTNEYRIIRGLRVHFGWVCCETGGRYALFSMTGLRIGTAETRSVELSMLLVWVLGLVSVAAWLGARFLFLLVKKEEAIPLACSGSVSCCISV